MVQTRQRASAANENEPENCIKIDCNSNGRENEKNSGIDWIQCMECEKWLENQKVDGIEGMTALELRSYEFYCRMCMMSRFSELRTKLNVIASEKLILEEKLGQCKCKSVDLQTTTHVDEEAENENWVDAVGTHEAENQIETRKNSY